MSESDRAWLEAAPWGEQRSIQVGDRVYTVDRRAPGVPIYVPSFTLTESTGTGMPPGTITICEAQA